MVCAMAYVGLPNRRQFRTCPPSHLPKRATILEHYDVFTLEAVSYWCSRTLNTRRGLRDHWLVLAPLVLLRGSKPI